MSGYVVVRPLGAGTMTNGTYCKRTCSPCLAASAGRQQSGRFWARCQPGLQGWDRSL